MESEVDGLATSSGSGSGSSVNCVDLVRPDFCVDPVIDWSSFGKTGEVEKAVVSFTGDVGDSRSLAEPVESFVRFFLRKPRVGMNARQ